MQRRGKLARYGIVQLNQASDRRLTITDLRVFIVISAHQGLNENAWPSLRTIAKLLTTDVSNIRKSRNRLVELGYVVMTPRTKESGANTSALYECIYQFDEVTTPQTGVGEPPSEGVQGHPQTGVGDTPKKNSDNNNLLKEENRVPLELEQQVDENCDRDAVLSWYRTEYKRVMRRDPIVNGKQKKEATRLCREHAVEDLTKWISTLADQKLPDNKDRKFYTLDILKLEKQIPRLDAIIAENPQRTVGPGTDWWIGRFGTKQQNGGSE